MVSGPWDEDAMWCPDWEEETPPERDAPEDWFETQSEAWHEETAIVSAPPSQEELEMGSNYLIQDNDRGITYPLKFWF